MGFMKTDKLTHGLKVKDYIGYALGDTAGLLSFALVGSFLQRYYTEVLCIQPAKIAVLMLIARIWDAINDPMWGSFIDSRKPSPRGRFRPYILGASIPLAISTALMYLKLPGLTEAQYLIFAYFTYILYGMMYTGTNVPYGSLASVVTDDQLERSSLSMWRSVGAGIGGLPAQIIMPLFIYDTIYNASLGKDVSVINHNKFYFCILILAVGTVILYYVHYKLTDERVTVSPVQKTEGYSLVKSLKAMFSSRPFAVICVVSMILSGFQFYTQTLYNYLLIDYFNAPKLYSLITVCTYLPMACFIPFMNKLIRRFGKKEICAAGVGAAALINFIMFVLKFTAASENPYVFLVLVFLSGAGQTFLVLEIWALVMDVIDYHELVTGRKEEGTCYSVITFMRKIGQTLAGAGSSALLAVIGYQVGTDVNGQSALVLDKLYSITTLVPGIALLIGFVLLQFIYPLSKSELEKVRGDLSSLREAQSEQ